MALGHPFSALRLPLILAINAAIFIVYGGVRRRWLIAMFGVALLALAALVVFLGVTA